VSRSRGPADVALSIAAALGVLCLLTAAAGFVLGVRPLLFRSGSMSPTIHTGDLALARSVPATALRVGDVVSVPDGTGHRVTHRLVAVSGSGDTRVLRLKGDANARPDTASYPVTHADRVLLHVPKAGYVLGALSGGPGLVLLGGYVTVLLGLLIRGDRSDPPPGPPRRRRARVVGAAGVAAAVVGGAGSASAAPWTDTVAISGQALTATTLVAPTVSCGTLNVGITSLTWTAVPGATGYTLHYGSNGAVTETVGAGVTSKTFSGLVTSGTFTVQASRSFGSTTWTSVASNAKNYTVLLLAVGLCGDA
jgi:signal peptidase I